MLAAWYERPGPAVEVLQVGEMADPEPDPGEVRVRLALSGVNPGDTKKRGDWLGYGMPFPRIVPHSDGSARARPRRGRRGAAEGAVLPGGVGAGHRAGVQQAAGTGLFTERIEPDPGWIEPCRDARARFTPPALHRLLA